MTSAFLRQAVAIRCPRTRRALGALAGTCEERVNKGRCHEEAGGIIVMVGVRGVRNDVAENGDREERYG